METNAFSMSLQNSVPTGNLLIKSLGQIGPRGDNAVWMMTFHIDLLCPWLLQETLLKESVSFTYKQSFVEVWVMWAKGRENVVWRRIITMTLTRAEVTANYFTQYALALFDRSINQSRSKGKEICYKQSFCNRFAMTSFNFWRIDIALLTQRHSVADRGLSQTGPRGEKRYLNIWGLMQTDEQINWSLQGGIEQPYETL